MPPPAPIPQEEHSLPTRTSTIHIIPALAALLILIGAIIYSERYASALEECYIHALAPLLLKQSVTGSVLQQAAFRQPDLLPIYGSSEMLNGNSPYRAYKFFATYPTGFDVFDIANSGDTSLDIAQDLAALGPVLRGKKFIISFTPSMFDTQGVSEKAYTANFSRMHAYAIVFSPYLSVGLKQSIAVRMLDYPNTLTRDPLLSFALKNLATGSHFRHFLYYMVFPLGQLNSLVIRMQDHYAVWTYILSHPNIKPTTRRKPRKIDWKVEIAKAEAQQKVNTNSNPYGIQNGTWIREYHKVLKMNKAGSGDKDYLTTIENTTEWGDLGFLLEVLKEMGADPVIMSRPINGTLYGAAGISQQAQQVYYNKLETQVSKYQIPLVDFQQYTNDTLFSVDKASHTGWEGWAIVDQVLDAFFHGNIH